MANKPEENSVYQQVCQITRKIIDAMISNDALGLISASDVARRAFDQARNEDNVPILIEWTSVEQFKQVARRELRGKFDHDSDDNETYQGDMFSGHLQRYYPVKEKGAEDPFYKLRELLTDADIDQNLAALKKQADARLAHYDALLAYKMHRGEK